MHDRWVRFHSLPGSQRYPGSADEYAEILDRHVTVLGELLLAAARVRSASSWS